MSEFLSSITDVDFSQEDDFLVQISQLKEEKEDLYSQLFRRDKEINEYKRKNEDQAITINHQKEMMKNNEALISFYKTQTESQASNEDSTEPNKNHKEVAIKMLSLEEENITLQTKSKQLKSQLDEMQNEKNELIEMKDNMINMLTDKEMDILELKTKLKNFDPEEEIGTFKDREEGNLYRLSTTDYSKTNNNNNENELKEVKRLYEELEQDFEEYKLKSDSELESMQRENKELNSNDKANKETIKDQEFEIEALKEELLLLQMEKEKFEDQSIHLSTAQRHNLEYLNEIDALQMKIRELKQLNEKLIISTDAQKSYVLSERNELDELYSEIKSEKNDLETQLSKLRETMKADYCNLQDKSIKEINEKNMIINQLQEIIIKKDEDISTLGIEKDKIENEFKSRSSVLLYKASKFEDEKISKEKKIADISLKAEIERTSLLSKIKELNSKNEELANRLNTMPKESNVLYHKENGITAIQSPGDDDEVIPLKDDIEAKFSINDTLKQEEKFDEKELNGLRQTKRKPTNERLMAEKTYLQKNNEALTLQIEALKTQRERDKASYLIDIQAETADAIKAKVSLASLSYEKDKELLKYRNYIKLIKSKLQGIGVTMKKRK